MIRVLLAGDAALLVDSDSPAAQLAAAVRQASLPGVSDVVPGARTVLVVTRPGSWDLEELAAAISTLPPGDLDSGDGAAVEIPVVYDGPDLAEVARLAGMTVSQVIEAHSRADYTVGWLGFSPGFGYLTGLDQRLAGVPRLASPRLSVPAGSVAIAGGMTAVYPSGSPGGWRLIGRTAARMWDPARDPPSLLAPGRRVRFSAIQARLAAARSQQIPVGDAAAAAPAVSVTAWGYLEVVRPGPLATVQDLGRPGFAAVGVPGSGAADIPSLVQANLLAGNPAGAAGLELTLGRAALRCSGPCTLAVGGAPASVTVRTDPGPSSQVRFGAAFDVPDGGLVSIGPPDTGLRSYVAVKGGIATPAVLGSRSADLLSGIGGPLRAGAILPVGDPATARARDRARAPAGDPAKAGHGQRPPVGSEPGIGVPQARVPARGQVTSLRILAGPRQDWFRADALATLCGSAYTVSPASNRTGLRLDGPVVTRSGDAELPSEGLVTGSLQVPPDGRPILLLADHPTVGGYPVLAVLASADIGLAAQLRPGDQIRFATVLMADALAALSR
jgi:KipI family sensor histidine kinase inhibitor